MKQKLAAFAISSAIILSVASPVFAGGHHHKHHHRFNLFPRNSISQNLSISQSGFMNQAAINAILAVGGGSGDIWNDQVQNLRGRMPHVH